MQLVSFGLMAVSLAAFLLSTRQFPLAARAVIWLVAAVLLAAAAWLALSNTDQLNLFTLLLKHPDVLLRAIRGNWDMIGGVIVPMFAVFLAVATAVALICLVAFTPGEAVERFVRPLSTALIGAIAGGLAALTIAGLGVGSAVKRQVYISVISRDDIIDGDTIRMGDVSLRLWGIDAPEHNQPCASPNDAVQCGVAARNQLADLLSDQLAICEKPNGASGAPQETFGRPLVTCTRQRDQLDVGREMIRTGCAAIYSDHGKVKSKYQNVPVDTPRACPPFDSPEAFRDRRGAATPIQIPSSAAADR